MDCCYSGGGSVFHRFYPVLFGLRYRCIQCGKGVSKDYYDLYTRYESLKRHWMKLVIPNFIGKG